MDDTINLQDLPDIALEKIFSYLTFNQIAENRIVSRKFNEVGKEALNRGYHMVEKFHRHSLKAVRSKLPRRESERKVHPLARQCDILVAIETRLSMLSMTFLKYMECKQCCFIPGKVIDELLRVIKYVNKSLYPPRPHDLLQELRDITSMAMEHFEERIVPILKERMNVYKASTMSSLLGNHLRVACNMPSTSISCDDVCSALRRNQSSSKVNRNLINVLLLEAKRSRKRDNLNKKQLKVTQNIVQQQKREIIKLKRVIQNWEAKFRDLSAEVRTISTHPFKRRGDSLEDDSVCVFVDTFDDDNMTPTRKSKKPRN